MPEGRAQYGECWTAAKMASEYARATEKVLVLRQRAGSEPVPSHSVNEPIGWDFTSPEEAIAKAIKMTLMGQRAAVYHTPDGRDGGNGQPVLVVAPSVLNAIIMQLRGYERCEVSPSTPLGWRERR